MSPRRLVALVAALIALPIVGTAQPASAAALPEPWASVNYGSANWGGVTLADIDGNGQPDIVTGDHDGYVHVRRTDGSEIWRSPAVVSGCSRCNGAPTAIDTTPTVADIDGDGTPEILVGVGSIDKPNQPGGLVVFNRNGSKRWSWYGYDTHNQWNPGAGADGFPESVRSAPAVGDVDGDGRKDIVFGGMDLRFYVLNADSSVKGSFYHDDTIFSSPALHDIDGNGSQEIFFGGDSTPGGPEDWDGGVFRALSWQGGLVEMWKQRIPAFFQSSPAIADIDGDGRWEVVTGTSNVNRPGGNAVYAYHLSDGSPVAGWPVATSGPTYGSIALGDLDGNGRPDVVASDLSGHIGAWTGNGGRLWYVDPHAAGEGGGEIASSPIIADLDGDGRQDVVTGNGWGSFTLRGSDGGRLYNPIGAGWSYHGVPAVGTFNGQQRLIIMGFNASQNRVASFNLPGSTPPAWGQFKANAAHLGGPGAGGSAPAPPPRGPCGPMVNPPSSPSSGSARGYWVLGAEGAVYSFGGAPFYGSLTSLGISNTAVNLSATPSGNGYWILSADGGVFSFGDAAFFGSMGGKPLNGPVVRLVPTSTGRGYWLLGSDGGVFSFGDAVFMGSMGGTRLNGPVISMSRTSSGKGYWLVGSDGGVFSFGDAGFHGSTGAQKLNSPIITMTAGPNGYWLLAGDGGVFAFDVPFYGSVPGLGLCGNPQGIVLRATSAAKGYWILAADGGMYTFGDAAFFGSQPGLAGSHRAVDLAPRI
jgi:hypothetical protein